MTGNGRQQGTSKMLEWLKAFTGAEKPAFVVAAALAFVVTLYLLIVDHTASAAVAGALTLALILFHNLPIVESFEVLGLKAKLVQRIGEAEQLLDHIRKSTSIAAKLLYTQFAWMNRWGTITWSKKRELLSEMDSVLAGLGVPQTEIDNNKLPFMLIISLDLYRVWENALLERVQKRQSIIGQELDSFGRGQAIDQNNPEYRRLMERHRTVHAFARYEASDILGDQRLRDVGSLSQEVLAQAPISEAEKAALEPVRTKVIDLVAACWRAGTVTPEAEVFLDRWENTLPLHDALVAAH